jgi:hypothetical protein
LHALLAVAVLSMGLGACAVVEGLSQYSKESCGQDCDDDGGADAGEPHRDGGVQDDGGAEDAPAVSTDTGGPDVLDASDGGSTTPESGTDAGGCGPVDTVDNCGACGVQCNTTTGTPSCTGTTCNYTCSTGRSNCNTTAPDTDGCECATPSCCGSDCETTHADGVGQAYYNCNAVRTYSEAAALTACAAYAASVGSNGSNCVGGLTCPGSSVPTVCFTTSGGECASYCWQYTGVYADGGPGTVWDCSCPAHVIGSWN